MEVKGMKEIYAGTCVAETDLEDFETYLKENAIKEKNREEISEALFAYIETINQTIEEYKKEEKERAEKANKTQCNSTKQ